MLGNIILDKLLVSSYDNNSRTETTFIVEINFHFARKRDVKCIIFKELIRTSYVYFKQQQQKRKHSY